MFCFLRSNPGVEQPSVIVILFQDTGRLYAAWCVGVKARLLSVKMCGILNRNVAPCKDDEILTDTGRFKTVDDVQLQIFLFCMESDVLSIFYSFF